MADLKISALTSATTPLAGTEVVPIVQSSTTKKVAVSDLTAGRAVTMSTASVGTTVSQKALTVATDQRFYNTGGDGVANVVLGDISSQVRDYSRPGVLSASFASIQFATDPTTWYKGEIRFLTNGSDGTGTAPTLASKIDISQNYVPSIAGKGINFTANTPAAGKTSQLLNWYEEGTFTPTFLGTVVGVLTATGTYTRVGRMVSFTINLVSTTSTTAVQDVAVIQGFPFVIASSHYPTFGIVNRGNSATVGVGNLALSGGQTTGYTPGWTALANVALSGFYYV